VYYNVTMYFASSSGSKAAALSVVVTPRRRQIALAIVEPALVIAEFSIVLLCSVLSGVSYHLLSTSNIGNVEIYAGVGLAVAAIYAVTARHSTLYQTHQLLRGDRDFRRALAAWVFSILVLALLLFVLKIAGSVSRGFIVTFAATGAIGVCSWRAYASRTLRAAFASGAVRGRGAILVGEQNELTGFSQFELLLRYGIHELDRFGLPLRDASGTLDETIEAVMQRAAETDAEEIAVALRWEDFKRIEALRSRFRRSPLPVRLLPDRAISAVVANDSSWERVRPFLVELQPAPLSPTARLIKRAMDLALGSCAVMTLAPLLVLTAIAIRLDSPGPVIFRQRRKGLNGREFVIYKFRTMRTLEDGPVVVQAIKGDPRVTRIGRLLRETSIDELPQLFNVIKGDMSLIGPRPHAVAHDTQYARLIRSYALRHHVKPGMTGWAQVHGFRGPTPHAQQMAQRVELDLWYIDNWSVLLDLGILIRTSVELICRRNAY
jgi:undecaprenyl-phosphate galactose phosphotransferase/putative colanic acid biosynthesis UDP-glucose lipid carrier transferase